MGRNSTLQPFRHYLRPSTMNVREPCTILDLSDELRSQIFRYANLDERFLCVNRDYQRIGTSVLAERIANDHADLTIAVALNSLHSCSRHFNTQDAALRLCYRVRKRIIQEIDNRAFHDAVRILKLLTISTIVSTAQGSEPWSTSSAWRY